MFSDGFAGLTQMLLAILGGSLLVFALVGFWRGLALRPHEPENRPKPPPFWWWTGW